MPPPLITQRLTHESLRSAVALAKDPGSQHLDVAVEALESAIDPVQSGVYSREASSACVQPDMRDGTVWSCPQHNVPVNFFDSYDGTTLAYRTIGTGPLLVCIPGGPGSSSSYLEDLAGLDASNTLLLLDPRGTGASAAPTNDRSFTAEDQAKDIEALREHLGLESLRLLGHSAGGRLAQVWAATNPERIERLVLVSTYLSRDGHQADNARVMALRSGEPWYAEAREAEEGYDYASPAERPRLLRMTRPFSYGAWTAREQEHAASLEGMITQRARSRFAIATSENDLRAGLQRLSAPVLVVGGELDPTPPPSAGRQLAEAIPNARYAELPGTAHYPWVDAPLAFSEMVGDFLAT